MLPQEEEMTDLHRHGRGEGSRSLTRMQSAAKSGKRVHFEGGRSVARYVAARHIQNGTSPSSSAQRRRGANCKRSHHTGGRPTSGVAPCPVPSWPRELRNGRSGPPAVLRSVVSVRPSMARPSALEPDELSSANPPCRLAPGLSQRGCPCKWAPRFPGRANGQSADRS